MLPQPRDLALASTTELLIAGGDARIVLDPEHG